MFYAMRIFYVEYIYYICAYCSWRIYEWCIEKDTSLFVFCLTIAAKYIIL